MTAALIIFGLAIAAALLYAAARLGDRPSRAEARQFEASLDAAWQKAPPAPALHHDWYAAPTITLAPALTDATPAGARAPEDRAVTQGWPRSDAPDHRGPGWPVNGAPAEPPAGEEDPGPDGAPEGDEPAARPPQGTTGPGDLLAKASAAVAALPVSDYLTQVQDATAWETRAPLAALLSDDTIARGMPAIKADA